MNEKVASQLLDKIQQFSDEHPDLVKGMLAGGGIGALGGAMLTGDDPNDPNESAMSRVMRRVKNGLIGGALGAGAVGGIGYGLNTIGNSLPKDDVSPEHEVGHSGVVRGLGALGLGGAGAEIARRRRNNAASDIVNALNENGANKIKATSGSQARAALERLNGVGGTEGKPKAWYDIWSKHTKSKAGGDKLFGDVTHAFGSTDAASKALQEAGINLDSRLAGNTQGLGKLTKFLSDHGVGTSRLMDSAAHPVSSSAYRALNSVVKHLGRNKLIYGLGAAGATLPEAIDYGLSKLGPNLEETALN